jgi:hypothetical protein
VISYPAYKYFGEDELGREVATRMDQIKEKQHKMKLPVRYRTRA